MLESTAGESLWHREMTHEIPQSDYPAGMALRVEQVADPAEFLARTAQFRDANPLETNVVGSVPQSIIDGSRQYAMAYWWLVLEDDLVVGCALHTPHYRPVLSPMSDAAAVLLADAMFDAHPTVRGVTGPLAPARAFGARLRDLTGFDATKSTLCELIYELGEHTPRSGVAGAARTATETDIPLLTKWFSDFGSEALGSIHNVTEDDVRSRMSQRDILIWEAAGVPVAMAGYAALIPTPDGVIGRIGPVFTVAEHRGHGYGAAITSAMVDHLRGLGCTRVILYTDADYPKSNRVYRAMGFEEVGAVVELGDYAD